MIIQKYFRDLNQKLFPILSIAETSDDFYKLFTDETTGFAFIAYYSDMIVGFSLFMQFLNLTTSVVCPLVSLSETKT